MPSAKGKGRALTPSNLSPLPLDQDPFGFAPVPDDEDMYMSRPMTPLVPIRVLTPPVFGENPVTPRHIQHPLGWQRVSSQERAAVDHNQQFKWVSQHHTPSSFHKERISKSNSFAMYDLGWAPAFWTPTPSPGASPRQQSVEPLPAPIVLNPPRHLGRIRQPVFRPDNVYGNRPPVDILADNNDNPFQGPSQGNQSPGPSGGGSGNNQPSAGPSASVDLTKMVQDGGANLINFLLRAAVSSTDAKGKIPEVSENGNTES